MEMELPGLLYAGMVFYAFFSSSDILKDKNYWLTVKKDLALKMIFVCHLAKQKSNYLTSLFKNYTCK
jgi:hypothetical protein